MKSKISKKNAETLNMAIDSTEKNIYSKCYYTTVHSRLLLQEKNNEITINSTAGGNV